MIRPLVAAAYSPRKGKLLVAIDEATHELTVADALLLAAEIIGAARAPHVAAELLERAITSPTLPLGPLPEVQP